MTISVAIIGAGFAGIGAAIRLKDQGITDFVIYERDSRVGGTWRDNTYPGAACDIPSRLYSYSFAPNPDWSHTYSGSAEILQYIDGMVATAGWSRRSASGTTSPVWSTTRTRGEWTVRFRGRKPVRARAVIVASGPLANVSLPDIPGIDSYEGKKIHSARWDHDFDFAGKKVAVVGTGASGGADRPGTGEGRRVGEGLSAHGRLGAAARQHSHRGLDQEYLPEGTAGREAHARRMVLGATSRWRSAWCGTPPVHPPGGGRQSRESPYSGERFVVTPAVDAGLLGRL